MPTSSVQKISVQKNSAQAINGTNPSDPTSSLHSNASKLRQTIRQQRRQLRFSQQRSASLKLNRLLVSLPCIRSAKHIGIYHASDGEINLQVFMQQAKHSGKSLYSPKTCMKKKQLSFHRQRQLKRGLKRHRWGFLEPCNTRQRHIKQLDVIIMPLVAFTSRAERMGMGGGFYDRALSFRHTLSTHNIYKKPLLIGVAHQLQHQAVLPQEPWDVPLNTIVTDTKIYHRKLN